MAYRCTESWFFPEFGWWFQTSSCNLHKLSHEMVIGTGFAIDCQEVNQAINQFSPRLGPTTTPFWTSCRCRIDRYGHNISTRTSFGWLIDWSTVKNSASKNISSINHSYHSSPKNEWKNIQSIICHSHQISFVRHVSAGMHQKTERLLCLAFWAYPVDVSRGGWEIRYAATRPGGFWSSLWIPHVFWREIRVCPWWRGGNPCRARVLAVPFSSAPFDEGCWFDNLDAAHKQMLLYFQFFVEGKDKK